MITAYIDFKSLDCFLAISPILKLADDCETPVSWQPYRSKERALPTQVTNESVTQTHHRVRRESERRLQQHYARLRGLDIDPSRGQIDTSDAHLGGWQVWKAIPRRLSADCLLPIGSTTQTSMTQLF